MHAVFFYVSGHGFGHASRQIEIINALPADIHVFVRTSSARWLFDRTVRRPFTYIYGETDTGVVQIDSLRLDERATIQRAAEFYRWLDTRARDEATLLAGHGARLVVSDAPPLACAAAALAQIPSVVISNFTWDWIYEGYGTELLSEPQLIPTIQEAYRAALAGWRLPMHGGFEPFASIVDLPFVARHAAHDRRCVRQRLDLPTETPLVLASFGGYGLQDFDPRAIDCLDTYGVVVTTKEPGEQPSTPGLFIVAEREMYARGLRYEDLVAAVDVVATKPGYGIVSECIANDTAVLYTSRGHFVEYAVLVAEMPRYLRCQFIELDALLGGRWRAPLDALRDAPSPPERPPTDGAAVASRMIQTALGF